MDGTPPLLTFPALFLVIRRCAQFGASGVLSNMTQETVSILTQPQLLQLNQVLGATAVQPRLASLLACPKANTRAARRAWLIRT